MEYSQTFLHRHILNVPVSSQEPVIQWMLLFRCFNSVLHCLLIQPILISFEYHQTINFWGILQLVAEYVCPLIKALGQRVEVYDLHVLCGCLINNHILSLYSISNKNLLMYEEWYNISIRTISTPVCLVSQSYQRLYS